MKLISDVIAELAMALKKYGDAPVVLPNGKGQCKTLETLRLDSVASSAYLEARQPESLYGTADEDGSELTVRGFRMDGREPVILLSTIPDDEETFGESVRRRREAAGWTQRDLGLHVCLSQSTISEIERGVRMPLAKEVIAIHGVLEELAG